MLSIYRASAGAGKTHRLTGEYLQLLFSQKDAFRTILAVTFTNKATEEMKSRIVEELFRLATSESSDYLSLLMKRYHLTEEQVRANAQEVLIEILHDYSAFNISTIDRFFQQTMRAFTREIGVQGGYSIEMNTDLILSKAADQMLSDLNKPENKALLNWLLKFVESKIEDGHMWNAQKDIIELGKELTRESYKMQTAAEKSAISDKEQLEEFKKILHGYTQTFENNIKELGKKGLDIIQRQGLKTTDYKKQGKTSPFVRFDQYAKGEVKAPSDSFWKLPDNIEEWYKKADEKDLKERIQATYDDGLNQCVKDVIALFENIAGYNTAKAILRHYYALGILSDLSKQVENYRKEKNVLLISDTTDLLNKVIANSEAPFIYEKTGIKVHHYMIDEFQDTSAMQWDNFRPLVEESMSHGNENLIVGDVKQSIYRFRNSDWTLLDKKVANDFSPTLIREETLKDNWRSCRHIVEFNNALFTWAPELLQNDYNTNLQGALLRDSERQELSTRILSAYKKSTQRVPKPLQSKEGHVQVRFIDDEQMDEEDTAKKKWQDASMMQLPGILQQLQSNGYDPKEIAILVRWNREAAAVANYLLEYKEQHTDDGFIYDIISDDSLYVGSSASVRFFVILMQYLNKPSDLTNEALALFAMKEFCHHWEWNEIPSDIQLELKQLSSLPLYEMVEKLYKLFTSYISSDEQIFILAFLDMIAEFGQKEACDLSSFLDWWEENGAKKTVTTPEGQNAIRLITIHKSKGLGFKAVIMPFCNWDVEPRQVSSDILWCRPQVAPFNKMPLLPISYDSKMGNTCFARDYLTEKMHKYIDFLNTLYVALTRAKEEMILLTPKPNKKNLDKNTSISALLWHCFSQREKTTDEGENTISLADAFRPDDLLFELGNYWKPQKKEIHQTIEEIQVKELKVVPYDNRLHLRLRGKNYFIGNEQRKHGTLMHEILSSIQKEDDIEPTLQRYLLQGVINHDEEQRLGNQLKECLHKPEVKRWYDGRAKVLNETEILFDNGASRRPDRIMIYPDEVVVLDYKFGEKKYKSYHSQIRNYMKLIMKMGYSKVKGYLWYVNLNSIEQVKP